MGLRVCCGSREAGNDVDEQRRRGCDRALLGRDKRRGACALRVPIRARCGSAICEPAMMLPTTLSSCQPVQPQTHEASSA